MGEKQVRSDDSAILSRNTCFCHFLTVLIGKLRGLGGSPGEQVALSMVLAVFFFSAESSSRCSVLEHNLEQFNSDSIDEEIERTLAVHP